MTVQRARRGRTRRAWLLNAGIASVAVYAGGDLLSGRSYEGYSFRDQAISELSAYGSPVRPEAVTWIALHGLLGGAFGVGVWQSAGANRALRWTAGFSLAAGLVTAPLHPFFPMSSRGMDPGFNDTMHQRLTFAFVPLVCGAVAASAVACPGWFRRYATASLAVIVGSGALMGPLVSALAENRPTPWLGALERVNAYTMHAWTVALAGVLTRRASAATGAGSGRASVPTGASRALFATHRWLHGRSGGGGSGEGGRRDGKRGCARLPAAGAGQTAPSASTPSR